MLGRYQPWHNGHNALYIEAQQRTAQVLLGVRNTYDGKSKKDPFTFDEVSKFIQNRHPNAFIIRMPNITNIVYGRDVGYKIEEITLPKQIQEISATKIRQEMKNEI